MRSLLLLVLTSAVTSLLFTTPAAANCDQGLIFKSKDCTTIIVTPGSNVQIFKQNQLQNLPIRRSGDTTLIIDNTTGDVTIRKTSRARAQNNARRMRLRAKRSLRRRN